MPKHVNRVEYTPETLPKNPPDHFLVRIGERIFAINGGREMNGTPTGTWAVNDITKVRTAPKEMHWDKAWNAFNIHIGTRFPTIEAAIAAASAHSKGE